MGKLSNDLLREKTMKQFLTAMNIDTTGVDVGSIRGMFSFSFADSKRVDEFASQLSILTQGACNSIVQPFSMATILESELEGAVCFDSNDSSRIEAHKAACKAIISVVKSLNPSFSISQETGLIEIPLPSPQYSTMLNLLKYEHTTFTKDGKLVLDYLKAMPNGVVTFTGLNTEQLPMVFLNTESLDLKQIFYATKSLPHNAVEITPYFFVPEVSVTPDYYFVLDISRSMTDALPGLKRSVIELAKQLFIFQPLAKLMITTFSGGVHSLGSYSSSSIEKLERDVTNIVVRDNTPLYEATANTLKKVIHRGEYNNILLFTDGVDVGSKPGSEEAIREILTDLGSELSNTTTRNKFYIFSYNTVQSELMLSVAKKFQSDVIDTTSSDFLKTQEDPEQMKRWAATRELFEARVIVAEKFGNANETRYFIPLDQSGQLASLEPKICRAGELLEIEIKDGLGNIVAAGTNEIKTKDAAAAAADDDDDIVIVETTREIIERSSVVETTKLKPATASTSFTSLTAMLGNIGIYARRAPNGLTDTASTLEDQTAPAQTN